MSDPLLTQSQSIASLAPALVAASAEMPAVPFDEKNPFLNNRFASLGSVIATARPILAQHGLAIMQFACSNSSGHVGVRTRLLHLSGEWIEGEVYLPVGEEKGKTLGQVAGSLITYLRRYSQSALLNLYADEDTDGGPPGGDSTRPTPRPSSTPVTPTKAATAAPGEAPKANGPALGKPEKCKARFLELVKEKKWEIFAWDYFVSQGVLMSNEKLDDVPADKVPQTADANAKLMQVLKAALDSVGSRGVPQEMAEAYDNAHMELPLVVPAEPGKREPWMDVMLHFGGQKGTKLIDLDRKKLYGWAKNYTPEPFKGKISEKDAALRKALDNALSWMDQNKEPRVENPTYQEPTDDDVPF